jgi:hypothetical protein
VADQRVPHALFPRLLVSDAIKILDRVGGIGVRRENFLPSCERA